MPTPMNLPPPVDFYVRLLNLPYVADVTFDSEGYVDATHALYAMDGTKVVPDDALADQAIEELNRGKWEEHR